MNAGIFAMLAGLLVVPVALLSLGHRLRRRTAAQRALFWGALMGYSVAACAALVAGMLPPADWSSTDSLRGAVGLWGMLVAPVIGGAVALALTRRPRPGTPASSSLRITGRILPRLGRR